ncbi:serine/threonine-protein kinase STY8 isoform X1 [Cryptomeria japonica]|uniref:serine/threonine-protein kinase STY8 isoform X1 n=2 Tax=Cryptomeria japonica TaxID=3369 RepID=UPI0025ACC0D6|nr:serine/threonine-protein kinase STY8 isoform X1 [Cryptomeria japonica]
MDANMGDSEWREIGAGNNNQQPQQQQQLSASSQTPEIWEEIYRRLVETENEVVNTSNFAEQLQAHFNRLPPRYAMDVNIERPEDVLIHQKLLELALIPENRPVFYVQSSERVVVRLDENEEQPQSVADSAPSTPEDTLCSDHSSFNEGHQTTPETCMKFKDLILDAGNIILEDRKVVKNSSSKRQIPVQIPIHEITFSTIDKPKLLSQLSALLGDIGLNIREAHVFSTNDGYSLDVFVVDGWKSKDISSLYKALEEAVASTEKDSWSRISPSSTPIERLLPSGSTPFDDCEVDRKLLKMERKVASGSCGDLYRGTYLGEDVAIKVLKQERLNEALEQECIQEIMILQNVRHKNVVRFIGACTKPPHICIITEYMSGGSLYDYLRRQEGPLQLPTLIKYAIDVSKGMEYLHENKIIHRDLKAANLLMDKNYVVKVADFGVARFLTQNNGTMTAETGTYRWMAPEVINHQPYDQKADVFSFAIVLWELLTAKLPYDSLTPLQAALGVRQGLRPPIPENTHPKVAAILEQCWHEDPTKRPSFSEITIMLEKILKEVGQRDD